MTNNFSTIIFDMDGVIIDSEKHWDTSTALFLKKWNIEYSPDVRNTIKPMCIGKSLDESSRILKNHFNLDSRIKQATKERIRLLKF